MYFSISLGLPSTLFHGLSCFFRSGAKVPSSFLFCLFCGSRLHSVGIRLSRRSRPFKYFRYSAGATQMFIHWPQIIVIDFLRWVDFRPFTVKYLSACGPIHPLAIYWIAWSRRCFWSLFGFHLQHWCKKTLQHRNKEVFSHAAPLIVKHAANTNRKIQFSKFTKENLEIRQKSRNRHIALHLTPHSYCAFSILSALKLYRLAFLVSIYPNWSIMTFRVGHNLEMRGPEGL